jgi:sugar/nucleoside kinase (ribokinase family)
MAKNLDAIICGSCVVDVLVRPVPLEVPIGGGQLVRTEPLLLTTGGIVSNTGITLSRLGMQVAAFTYVGDDEWADVILTRYAGEGIEISHLITHESAPTSTTAVLIDPSGERSFMHAVGAPKLLDKQVFLANLAFFARSRVMLLGYYSLLPSLQNDLAEVLAAIRQTGCQTALDAAGDGGTLDPLAECLPHLDYYVPSFKEASHQTGESDPQRIIAAYRAAGAPGLVGVKLGTDGALLSPQAGEFVEVAPVKPPGEVVDTTGAGDCFYGGLLAGILCGLSVADAGKLAAAAGACCVTGLGATAAIRRYNETAKLAGIV